MRQGAYRSRQRGAKHLRHFRMVDWYYYGHSTMPANGTRFGTSYPARLGYGPGGM